MHFFSFLFFSFFSSFFCRLFCLYGGVIRYILVLLGSRLFGYGLRFIL